LITTDKYVELLKEKNLFYYLYHRMWNKVMKQKLTAKVNKLLGTKYSSKEAGDFDFNENNPILQENSSQLEQEQH